MNDFLASAISMDCANPRFKNYEDHVTSTLTRLQIALREFGANLNGFDSKLDSVESNISALRSEQQHVFEQMIPGELDTLFKKNLTQLAMQSERNARNALLPSGESHAESLKEHQTFHVSHAESLRRLEQGVSDLNAAHKQLPVAGAGVTDSQGKDFAEYATGNDLSQVQSTLMNELRVQQEELMRFKTQQETQLELFLRECGRLPDRSWERREPEQISDQRGVQVAPVSLQQLPEQSSFHVAPVMDNLILPTQGFSDEPISSMAHRQEPPSESHFELASDEEPVQQAPDIKQEEKRPDSLHKNEEDTPEVFYLESSSLGGVFLNDDDVESPTYHVESMYFEKGLNQRIARSDLFANFTVGVVVFNAVYIGFDSDYNDATNIYDAELPFQLCSQFFCVYFTWELLVRFLAFKKKRNCLKDGWFKFDAFLVSTMILDTWVLMPTLFVIGGGIKIPTQPLRMLRLFKLTRMARLMKAFPELVTMIKGLVRSLRAISSSMILVGLMVYVWAIMLHMLLKHEHELNDRLWKESLLGFNTIDRKSVV